MRSNTIPVLPLNQPVPFLETLGVMLYPGITEQSKAKSFVSRNVAEPLRKFVEGGGVVKTEELLKFATENTENLDDLEKRRWGGRITGELIKIQFTIYMHDKKLASAENALKMLTDQASGGLSGTRSSFLKVKKQFSSVAHLWAAWRIREEKWFQDEAAGYDAQTDFLMFIAESEIVRNWATNWKPDRAKASTPLSGEFWTPPEGWRPPVRKKGWPLTGVIPRLTFLDAEIPRSKPPGRPKK